MDRPIGVGAWDWKDARREPIPVEELIYLDESASGDGPVATSLFGPFTDPQGNAITAEITGVSSAPLYDWKQVFPNSANASLGQPAGSTYLSGTASAYEINGNANVPVNTFVLLFPSSGLTGEGYLFSYQSPPST